MVFDESKIKSRRFTLLFGRLPFGSPLMPAGKKRLSLEIQNDCDRSITQEAPWIL